MTALEVRDLTYTVTRVLLDGITAEFHPGEVTAVSGPSGSGKTTLLSIAGGLLPPTTGSATYDGSPTWQGSGDPRPEIAFVLQVYGLVPILSARENVSVALRARGVAPLDADERAEAALARFHIADLGDRQVEELSGGQMQRVACARAFVVGAAVLLADEPTSELDEGNRSLVLRELRAEAEQGSIVVVATHDPAVVEAADRHYALDEGRLVLAEMVGARVAARSAAVRPVGAGPRHARAVPAEPTPAEPAPEEQTPEEQAPQEQTPTELARDQQARAEQAPVEPAHPAAPEPIDRSPFARPTDA